MKEDSAQMAGKQRLEERIAPFKLRVNNDTDAEGACQFDSAADQLRLVRPALQHVTKEEVRATTIAWLRENPGYRLSDEPDNADTLSSWVSDTQGISWDKYLSDMSAPFAWGDEITLKGIVEAFRVRIMLLSSTVDPDNYYSLHRPKGVDGGKDDCPTLWMCHFLEVHYGSLLSDLEYERRQEQKRKQFVQLVGNMAAEKQLDALTDIVLLDNSRAFSRWTKFSVGDAWKQSGQNISLAFEMVEASEGKVLTIPLRRIHLYGGGGSIRLSANEEKIQMELSRALSIIKSLKDENAQLRMSAPTAITGVLSVAAATAAPAPPYSPVLGGLSEKTFAWSALIDEDGKKWLQASYSIPESEAGEMLALHRLALHGATPKLCQRLPLPSSGKGSLLFEFPNTVGHYELQYSRKGIVKARSDAFLNRPHVLLAFGSINGRRLDVEWTMTDASVAQASDWVALYRADEANLPNYICFSFVNPASNVVTLHLPAQISTSKFVVRYFCGDNKWYPVAIFNFEMPL